MSHTGAGHRARARALRQVSFRVATVAPESRPQPRDPLTLLFFPFSSQTGIGREGGACPCSPRSALAAGREPPGDRGSRSDSSCTEGSAPLSPTRPHRRLPLPSVPSGDRTWWHPERSSGAPGDPERGGVPGPHPVPAGGHDPGGEPAKMAAARRDRGRRGSGGLGLRPLAHDSAESGAAAGEHRGKVLVPRDARIRVEEMLLHVLGRRLLGLLVGGAAGSPQGHGPGSPCTWPVQPLRQAYEWKTPFLHALVKRTNL